MNEATKADPAITEWLASTLAKSPVRRSDIKNMAEKAGFIWSDVDECRKAMKGDVREVYGALAEGANNEFLWLLDKDIGSIIVPPARQSRPEALEAIAKRRNEELLAKEARAESRPASGRTTRQAGRHRIPRREVAKALGGNTRDLADKLDYIENLITVYRRQVEGVRTLPKASERKRQLARFNAALEVLLEDNKTAELFFRGTNEYADLRRAAKSLQRIAAFSLKARLRKGPDRDERKPVIQVLARIFEGRTCQRATITYNPNSDHFVGRFFSFVRACFTPLDPFQSENALGVAVRDALRTRRTRTK